MMSKYLFCVLLGAVLMAPAVAFADAETVDFDALMTTGANFVYGGDHVYAFSDPDGYWKDDYDPSEPHEWVKPCDNNENGIPDAVEFAVLSAIFANTSAPHHTELHDAWKANVTQAATDLGALAAGLTGVWLKQIMGGLVLLGGGSYSRLEYPVGSGTYVGYGFEGSWGMYAEIIYGMSTYGSMWADGAPDAANYQSKEALVSACGDVDGDGTDNINEYYAQGGPYPYGDNLIPAVRTAYVAAVLSNATTTSAADPNDVCTVVPPPSADLVWGTTIFYNPDNKHVYILNPQTAPWPVMEMWAEGFTVKKGKVAVPGTLVRVDSQAEADWIKNTVSAKYGNTVWLGATDATWGTHTTTEGAWIWVDDGTKFWQGTHSGTLTAGMYAAWTGSEPNNSGGTENFGECYTSGGWNDNDIGAGRAGLAEFTNGGAGYPDVAPADGWPDFWMTYVPAPVAAFHASATSGFAPLTVTFTDDSTPGTGQTIASWLWNFGDGTPTSALQTPPSHVYGVVYVDTYYTVSLTVTTAKGSDTETKTGYIHAIPSLAGVITSSNGSGWYEVHDTLSLTVAYQNAVPPVQFLWKLNGNPISGATNQTYTKADIGFGDAGMYVCQMTDAHKLVVPTPPHGVFVFPFGALPVAGLAGLLLLAGACILGARYMVRKK